MHGRWDATSGWQAGGGRPDFHIFFGQQQAFSQRHSRTRWEVLALIDVTLSQHAPLGLKTGSEHGPQKNPGRILVRAGLEGLDPWSPRPKAKQARSGQGEEIWRRRGRRRVKTPRGRER